MGDGLSPVVAIDFHSLVIFFGKVTDSVVDSLPVLAVIAPHLSLLLSLFHDVGVPLILNVKMSNRHFLVLSTLYFTVKYKVIYLDKVSLSDGAA